jgi:hypothetical protein
MDFGEVPGRVADLESREMAVLVRHFETAGIDGDGAIAFALGAWLGPGEGALEGGHVGARSHHRRAAQKAIERRFVDLRMALAIVVGLDPGEGCLVESGKRQIDHAFEHGHQSRLNNGPEMFKFPVHIRAVRQCCLM